MRRRGPAPSTALLVAWWFPPLGLVLALQARAEHPPGSRGRSLTTAALAVGAVGTVLVLLALAAVVAAAAVNG